jgi:hypothetical protein
MEPIKPRASTRISIQWSAGLPQEETDTLVLTLPGHYLDLRVYRAGHPREGTIEWAQAGYVEQIPSETGKASITSPRDCATHSAPQQNPHHSNSAR